MRTAAFVALAFRCRVNERQIPETGDRILCAKPVMTLHKKDLTMSHRLRQWIINACLLLVSSLVGFAIVEFGMHLAGLDYPLVWEPDPQLGWHDIPGARRHWTEEGNGLIEINMLGHRDRERQLDKSHGSYRIAAFGDSMTEAVQVNIRDTFTQLLEGNLRDSGHNVEVLNFGVSGYSPVQELLHYKREGPQYQPDLVILAVFLDNDVSGCHPQLTVSQAGTPFLTIREERVQFDYTAAELSFLDYHKFPIYWIRKYSRIFRAVSAWRWQHKGQKDYARTIASGTIPTRFKLYYATPPAEWEEAWKCFDATVLEFAEEVRRQRTRLVILSIPASFVVDELAWSDILKTFPSTEQIAWDLDGPEKRLLNLAELNGLTLIQPYLNLRKMSKGSPLFWNNVGHLTPSGHRVIAKSLQDYLIEKNLLDPLHGPPPVQ
jgi:lysophospholipase L1-like esterase